MKIDCQFVYFKPSGKFYASGTGQFPNQYCATMTREIIRQWSAGKMPGLVGEAKEFVIIVLPSDECKSDYAFPRMIKEMK